jgi:hypothetical protein
MFIIAGRSIPTSDKYMSPYPHNRGNFELDRMTGV